MTIYYYEPPKISNITFIKDYNIITNDIVDQKVYTITKEKNINDILTDLQKMTDIKTIIIDAESNIFSDIEFKVDNTKIEVNSETLKQDVMSGISLGNSVMLDAIADQKFVILPGRKTGGIKNNLNQNHDCIDAIASNGLLSSPKVMTEYSIGKILNEISNNHNLKELNLYIIHSALKVDKLNGNGINTYNIPRYAVGRGEILSVFFRYIALLFFPYLSVWNSLNDDNIKYDV